MVRIGIGVLIGAAVGAFASAGWLIAQLFLPGEPGLAHTALVIGGLVAGGAAAGGLIQYYRQHRLPLMLPHYRREHLRLRQIAQQLRQNLSRLTGVKSSYPELDEILRKDADLRHRATHLRLQILKDARRGLTWVDHLRAGIEFFGEGFPLATGRVDRTEWVWRAYRIKLEREVQQLGRKLERNRDAALEERLLFAYRQKAHELASFRQLERTLHQLETEMSIIVAGLESLLVETIRLGGTRTPAAAQVSTDQLLEPLRQQLRAFEQAMQEMDTPAESELLHLRQGIRRM
ncbi:hypothetical protein HRbin15_00156 [bacterium HR15]|nr:hypothetical protein HRbin15_00156 [bacterium HR15]